MILWQPMMFAIFCISSSNNWRWHIIDLNENRVLLMGSSLSPQTKSVLPLIAVNVACLGQRYSRSTSF